VNISSLDIKFGVNIQSVKDSILSFYKFLKNN